MSRNIIPRSMIRYIRMQVADWEDGEYKELVKILLNSHEELRWEAERYKRHLEITKERRRVRK